MAAAVIAFSSGPGQSYVFSVFLDSILDETGLSRTAVSALYAVGSGMSAVMVTVVSRKADRYGPRRVLAVVAVLLSASCMLMAISFSFVTFVIAFAALRAFGQGSIPINGTLLVAQWFVRFRGRSLAMMGLGFAASTAILPPVSRLLIEGVGWRQAYAVLGIMVLVLLLPLAWAVVRDRPEDIGLGPDGDRMPAPAQRAASSNSSGALRDSRPVFTSPGFWMLALPLATSPFVVTALIFHQTSIFDEQGLDAEVAAATFVPYAVANAPTVVLAGALIDRFGPRPLFGAAMALLLIALAVALVLTSPLLAVVYGAILGATGGFSQVISGFTWAHFYGREGLGRIQGSGTMVGIAAAALGPLPLAALEVQFGGFGPPILLMMVLPVAAAMTMLAARPKVTSLAAST